MTKNKLKEVLASHQRWLDGASDGKLADLSCADLRNADLSYANLRSAKLSNANLSNANLRCARLLFADLSCTNLRCADLRNANLHYTNLHRANLRFADLSGADLDYSAWPLKCDSLEAKIDKRIAAQLLYHALRAMQSCADEPDVAAVLVSEPCLKLANQFHHVKECGRIEPPTGGGEG